MKSISPVSERTVYRLYNHCTPPVQRLVVFCQLRNGQFSVKQLATVHWIRVEEKCFSWMLEDVLVSRRSIVERGRGAVG